MPVSVACRNNVKKDDVPGAISLPGGLSARVLGDPGSEQRADEASLQLLAGQPVKTALDRAMENVLRRELVLANDDD